MITDAQGQQQFDCADLLEAAVLKGRWKGIVPDKLWLVECDGGIMIEVELDKCVKHLSLMGEPDVLGDGRYQLRLMMREGKVCHNPKVILDRLVNFTKGEDCDTFAVRYVECDQIWEACCEVLDALTNNCKEKSIIK